MRRVIFTNKFEKEYIKLIKRGKDLEKLQYVTDLLARSQIIPERYRDHKLKGEFEGSRELHIEPDWLLIYRIEGEDLILERIGTHSDLFK